MAKIADNSLFFVLIRCEGFWCGDFVKTFCVGRDPDGGGPGSGTGAAGMGASRASMSVTPAGVGRVPAKERTHPVGLERG